MSDTDSVSAANAVRTAVPADAGTQSVPAAESVPDSTVPDSAVPDSAVSGSAVSDSAGPDPGVLIVRIVL